MTRFVVSGVQYVCMFVRVRKQQGKKGPIPYAYLVENHWNPFRKKHEQKILASLGRVANLPVDGTVEKMITALDSFATKMGFSSLSDGIILSNLSGEKFLSAAFEYGSHLLSSHILGKLSFLDSIAGILKRSPDKYIRLEKVLEGVKVLIAHRLYDDNPVSELSSFNWYTNQLFTFQENKDLTGTSSNKKLLSLADLYRTLDTLITHKDQIEKEYYEQNKTLFNGELDIVLFDTTSVYYYGKQNPERKYTDTDLLQYGYSKDGKGDLKQLIVGVLMTRDGVPIAHEVFKGNTSDVVSFAEIINILKKKYQIGKVILIADRGMVSEENLRILEAEKLSYLLGVRMRKLSPLLREKLLVGMTGAPKDTSEMEKVTDNLYTYEYPLSRLTKQEIAQILNQTEKGIRKRMQKKNKNTPLVNPSENSSDETNSFSETTEKTEQNDTDSYAPVFDKKAYQNDLIKRKYFVCLNPSIEKATRKNREYFKEIIQKKIKTKSTKEWIVKNGYKKYIEFEDKVTLKLNEEKLKEEELYDGKWVLITSDQTITASVAGIYYKSLQFVERGFHDLKSLITIRPIYHFKEKRIRAHIFVCFLSLIVKWYIFRTINKTGQEDGKRFIEEMIKLKAIAVDRDIPLYVRTALSPTIQEQMKKLGMIIPAKVIIDGRIKPNKHNPKGGRPRKVDPNKFQLPLLKTLEQK